VRWLTARHFFDAKGSYEMDVFQEGQELDGSLEKLDLSGPGFTLDVDLLDEGFLFAGQTQQSMDSEFVGLRS
jgi:hypothetical protein